MEQGDEHVTREVSRAEKQVERRTRKGTHSIHREEFGVISTTLEDATGSLGMTEGTEREVNGRA